MKKICKNFIFIILLLSVFFCYSCNSTTITSRKIKKLFSDYNNEYSLNLPEDFEKIFSYRETAIDGYEYLMIVKPLQDYQLQYTNQLCTDFHDDFDIREHFDKINQGHSELMAIANAILQEYDWFAYEKQKGNRTTTFIVIHEKTINYLFVYYIHSQYVDCF